MFSDASLTPLRYRHTQRAGLLLLVLGGTIAIIVLIVGAAVAEWDPVAVAVLIPVLVVLGFVFILFSSPTVVVDDEALRIAFGPGLVRYA